MDSDELDRALAGDPKAAAALEKKLRSIIHGRVARVLRRATAAEGRDPREEVCDLTQDVLLMLYRDDAKVLRQWEPERGTAFIGLIAERHVIAVLRSQRRNPYTNLPVSGEAIDGRSNHSQPTPEGPEWMDQMLHLLADELDEDGQTLFRLMYVEERSIDEVCALTGKSRDAVYAWRLRFKRRFARLLSMIAPNLMRQIPVHRAQPPEEP